MHQNTVSHKENEAKSSEYWYNHFNQNLKIERVDWELHPKLSEKEKSTILSSLKAWQLGGTSDGRHLLRASEKYARKNNDLVYVEAVKLFIKEEQKHGNNLGKYLDLIGEKRIDYDWGDYLFRKIRYFNTNMELWTLTVITVESTAQLFYQSLKDATNCALLKQICTDILIDEAFHIEFQAQRVSEILKNRQKMVILLCFYFYKLFYFTTILVVWFAHQKVFKAGQNNFGTYWKKMNIKFKKTIERQKNIALSAK